MRCAHLFPTKNQLTVPTLTGTEQLAVKITAVISSFTIANFKVTNVYNRAVAEQLADRSYMAAALLLLCRTC
jgi:hypothetical protein